MAPKSKAAKRARSAAAPEPEAKAAKIDYAQYGTSKAVFEAVLEVLRSRADLSEGCREMLVAMVPFSLCVFADERDEHQALAVKMMEEVFDSSLSEAQTAVDDATAAVGTAEASKADLAATAAEAESALSAAVEETEAKKAAKVQAVASTAEAKKALSTKSDEQEKGDATVAQLKKDKEAFEAVIASEWKTLMDGSWDKPAHAKKLFGAVERLTKKLALEESMLAALPSVCTKAPSVRGAFDTMVLQGCEQKLTEKVAELDKEIEGGAAGVEERAAAVQAAQAALDATKTAQEAAEEALAAAQAQQKEATAAAKAAKQAVAASGPACEKAAAALEGKKEALQGFTQLNMGSFQSLRDAVRPKPKEEQPPEPPAAEPPAEAAAAEAVAAPEEAVPMETDAPAA